MDDEPGIRTAVARGLAAEGMEVEAVGDGHSALEAGLSMLELVRVHHEVLIEVLQDSPAGDVGAIGSAGSDFLLEVLSSYDMMQRGFRADS